MGISTIVLNSIYSQLLKIFRKNKLNNIDIPKDLRSLSEDKLPEVCQEIRQEIIDVCSHNPGHLASSLGAVELAVALHYVFDTPEDKIIWDVGHQAYAHKILTGRREAFKHNRELNGVRPFPSPLESEYDVNTCGHASNSISIALGIAVAAAQQNEDRKVVAVIGDGAMSGGLAYEALNNVSVSPNNLLIILNDNNMSISNSVGGMKQYLRHLHTSNLYNTIRFKAANKMKEWGLLTENGRRKIIRFNNSIKSLIYNQQNIFEGLNIRYFGPMDGNNILELVRTIREIKDMKGPRILHVYTVKGKGFKIAEQDATVWHAPGKYDPVSGERLKVSCEGLPPRFQDVFGETLVELAEKNPKIVGVTPAMLTGCSMDKLKKVFPERTFDVGIAEGHAVTFSAGMALDGLIPFCNIYSSFSQRAYDNIIHDVAITNEHVVLCLDRAGIVGEDGPTHQPVEQTAELRLTPNMSVWRPCDQVESAVAWKAAIDRLQGPTSLIFSRQGLEQQERTPEQLANIAKGGYILRGCEGTPDLIFIATGSEVALAMKAADTLSAQGKKVRVVSMPSTDVFDSQSSEYRESVLPSSVRRRVAIEAGISDYWYKYVGLDGKVVGMNTFGESAPADELFKVFGFTVENVVKTALELF